MRLSFLFMLLLLSAGLTSCGRRTSTPAAPESTTHEFRMPTLPPETLAPEERRAYMRTHYWDRFDFGDTLRLPRLDTLRMIEAFATYVAQYVTPEHPEAIDSLMQRAAASRPMFEYFRMLSERVLHDPNSPLRNDELYIPVLQAALESPWLDAWERLRPEEELRLALQNRVEQQANDFTYEQVSGTRGTLYGNIRSEYTILFFTNPECPMCSQLCAELNSSPRMKEWIERGDLCIVALYADSDTTAWRAHAETLPMTWLYVRDAEGTILSEGRYDLKAIPSLYLLDRNKRVLVKDTVSIPELEEAIDRHTSA